MCECCHMHARVLWVLQYINGLTYSHTDTRAYACTYVYALTYTHTYIYTRAAVTNRLCVYLGESTIHVSHIHVHIFACVCVCRGETSSMWINIAHKRGRGQKCPVCCACTLLHECASETHALALNNSPKKHLTIVSYQCVRACARVCAGRFAASLLC